MPAKKRDKMNMITGFKPADIQTIKRYKKTQTAATFDFERTLPVGYDQ